jgi:excisionase family DNA binding protein
VHLLQENKNPEIIQRWFTTDEAALYLRCSPQTIRGLIHRRELRASRLGQDFRLDRSDLDRLLERGKQFHNPYRKGTHPWVATRHAQNRRRAAR